MLHTIQNAFLSVTVSEQGAQLQSILGSDGTEYLWQGDPRYWADRDLTIFPYVARLTEGSYYLDGNLHHMQIHGIAPYHNFSPEVQPQQLIFTLSSDAQTQTVYPREFVFRVTYTLHQRMLQITYEVENRDNKIMYFGLGGHPGFQVPLVPALQFEDYRLRFSDPAEPRRIGFTEDCFVDGTETPFPLEEQQVLHLNHSLFDEDAIVLKDICHQVTLESEKDPHSVTVTFPDMPYLGLWHWPKTDAPYLCIEPWSSLPAKAGEITVFEQQPDLLRLKPGDCCTYTWTVSIK